MKKKYLILFIIISISFIGCNMGIEEELKNNSDNVENIIQLPDETLIDAFNVDNLDLNKVKDTMDIIPVEIYNGDRKMNVFGYDKEFENLSFINYSPITKTLFFLKSYKDNPYSIISIWNHDTNKYSEIPLGKEYSYLDSSHIKDGSCQMIFSNTSGTFDFVEVSSYGDVRITQVEEFDRIASTTWDGGTVVSTTVEENQNDKIQITSKIFLIEDESSDFRELISSNTEINLKEDSTKLDEGSIISIPNVSSGGLGYQLVKYVDEISLERYYAESYWIDLRNSETYKIEGLNELCTYFAGNGDFFLALVSSDKAIEFPDVTGSRQNGFLYLKEDDMYNKYSLSGYDPIYNITFSKKLNEKELMVINDFYVDKIDIDKKTISRISLKPEYSENSIMEKYYIKSYQENKLYFLEMNQKDNNIFLYVEK